MEHNTGGSVFGLVEYIRKRKMLKFLAIGLLAASSTYALAQATPPAQPGDIGAKQAEDNPGTTGGTTANPTAKDDGSKMADPASKQMDDHPGTSASGRTANPTAQPSSSAPGDKQEKDLKSR